MNVNLRAIVRERDDQETLQQLVTALQAIEIGIDAYRDGKSAGWMIVSAYLNQLLADISGGNKPLLDRILSDLDFDPLRNNLADHEGKFLLSASGFSKENGGASSVFNLNNLCIPKDSWLKQVIYIQPYQNQGFSITLLDLVRWSRNQGGGVHFDQSISLHMHLIEGMFSFIIGENPPTYRNFCATRAKMAQKCEK